MFGTEVVAEAGSAPVIGKFFLAQFAHNFPPGSFFKTKISAHRMQQRLLIGVCLRIIIIVFLKQAAKQLLLKVIIWLDFAMFMGH